MDAVVARDGEAAERRMGRHVGAYISDVQQGLQPKTLEI
jgi:DNA-binding GntR family transcriptional regulator